MGRNGTSKGILLFLVLLLCLTAIVLLGAGVFQVKKITVISGGTLSEDAIINLSGITRGDNIFKISKAKVKNRMENNPPFPVVQSISFRLPAEVVLVVRERVPVAVIPYLSSHIIIDGSGFVLNIVKQQDDEPYPVVEGVPVTSLTRGSLLSTGEHESYREKILLRLLGEMDKWKVGGMLKGIGLENPDNIVLTTKDGIQVQIGQAVELDKKFGWLKSEAYQSVLKNGKGGTLDVRVPDKAVYRPEGGQDAAE
jgi:cell division protein FtsQ